MSKRVGDEASRPESRTSAAGQPSSPPSAGPSPRPPTELDADALARLHALDPAGKSQLIARVVDAFSGSIARMLPQLREAAQAGDLGRVRHIVHTLKSSSANVGGLRLSQLCAELELRLRQGSVEGLVDAADEIAGEVVAVDDALRQLPTNAR